MSLALHYWMRCTSLLRAPRLRNDLYYVEWDVKLYYTIPFHSNRGSISYHFWDKRRFQSKITFFPPHVFNTCVQPNSHLQSTCHRSKSNIVKVRPTWGSPKIWTLQPSPGCSKYKSRSSVYISLHLWSDYFGSVLWNWPSLLCGV